MMNTWQAENFRSRFRGGLLQLQQHLDLERSKGIGFAHDVQHTYDDKYVLSSQISKCAGEAILGSLQALGLTVEKLVAIKAWAATSSVSLRFQHQQTCEFLREATRKEDSATSVEVEYSLGGLGGKTTSKVVTTITEYFYNYAVTTKILAIRGAGLRAEDTLEIFQRTGNVVCIVRGKQFPYPESTGDHVDVELGWLLRQVQVVDGVPQMTFGIDRDDAECRTPTRNRETKEAREQFQRIRDWQGQVQAFYRDTVISCLQLHARDACSKLPLQSLTQQGGEGAFVPVLPLLVETDTALVAMATTVDGTHTIPESTLALLLRAHEDSLRREIAEVQRDLPVGTGLVSTSAPPRIKNSGSSSEQALVTQVEGQLLVVARHLGRIVEEHSASVSFLEDLLRSQLVSALGKEISALDFARYMQYHQQKIFRPQFAPRPFSVAVRRSAEHAPEGTVSLETEGSTATLEPVRTYCRTWVSGAEQGEVVPEMSFALDAATRVRFTGTRHLHAFLAQSFNANLTARSSLQLTARARQFSCYLVLLGRISSATTFEAKHAFFVQNKEEISIPILTETIPSAQEFRDAISSLSPEQQRFAQAYRAMQLESTLFAVLVIQVKPALESLLRLPRDALTKEISLTQDLLRLFVDYQIPADLLAVDEEHGQRPETQSLQHLSAAETERRLSAVKQHVQRVRSLLEEMKQQEVAAQKQARAYEGRDLQQSIMLSLASAPPPPPPAASSRVQLQMRMESAAGAKSRSMFGMSQSAPAPASAALDLFDSFSSGSAPVAAAASTVTTTSVTSSSAPSNPQSRNQSTAAAEESALPVPDSVDWTKYPKRLESAFDRLNSEEQTVRPTILTPGDVWSKRKGQALTLTAADHTPPAPESVNKDAQRSLQRQAFDLLDALTRSGAAVLEDADLHIVIAATQSFPDSVMNCVVQRNLNPIEDAEQSAVVLAMQVHGAPAHALTLPAQLPRLLERHPAVFVDGGRTHNLVDMDVA